MIVAVHPIAGFDKVLHYRVPDRLRPDMAAGSLVRMPILRRFAIGVVSEMNPVPDVDPMRLKPIADLVYPFPALTPDLLKLATWMSAYYAANLDQVLEAMIPASIRRGMALKMESRLESCAALAEDELEHLRRRAPQQAKLYEFIRAQLRPVPKALALKRLGVGPSSSTALVKRGAIREVAHRIERIAYRDEIANAEAVPTLPPVLNSDQLAAVASIDAGIATGKFGVHLLHGVTGSGKTEVYLHALDAVLKAGGGGLYLVPEVALTPQTVARMRGRLEGLGGHKVVVWHSHLSEGERLDGWLALASGEARVVVGARSAVFAPVQNLQLVIVDEEHEPAYKQDETPRYHGRDVAVYRAKLNRAICVLGSATPSIESIQNVRRGRYKIDRLPVRIDNRIMPRMHVVDMRREFQKSRAAATLSRVLIDGLSDRLKKREQSILFINRRGFSSAMLCTECGYIAECDQCSVSMTYHRSDETLKCHLCGAERPSPLACPKCRSPKIRWRGTGTQKVEEALKQILPTARVVRMDADTMGKKNRFREILGEFRLGKIDVLVGTQMIGKGLDFPNVTLVGLVDADISMHVPDFRAQERTFQLLLQVAGRSGRGDREGEVFVQTFTPQAGAIQFARHNDFEGFIETEVKMREQFGYPPFRHLVHHLFRGQNVDKVKFVAEAWTRQVERELAGKLEIRGPAPAPIERVEGEWRFQVWYLAAQVTKIVPELVRMQKEFAWPDGISQMIDVDPVSLC